MIQEGNHGHHLKARRLLQPEILQQGILFVTHAGTSPDPAHAEGRQGESENKLASVTYEVIDAQASTLQRAEVFLKQTS